MNNAEPEYAEEELTAEETEEDAEAALEKWLSDPKNKKHVLGPGIKSAKNSQRPQYNLTNQELQAILSILPSLPETEKRALLVDLERYEKALERKVYQDNFIKFVEKVWPGFISGRHHKIMARAFEKVARGDCKRLIINMPPRHTKSEFASYLLPAWFLGKFPEKKVIQTSHTA